MTIRLSQTTRVSLAALGFVFPGVVAVRIIVSWHAGTKATDKT